MQALIRAGAKDFYVRQKAIDILLEQGVRPKDYLNEIRALFEWVRRNVRYTKDPYRVEVLHSARRMLELRAGDCDDMTILLCAMLKSIGHPVRMVLIGLDPGRPRLFSHVYLEVNYRGRWIPLDPTMPYPMGWAPPAAHRKVFHVEKESNMLAMTDDEWQRQLGGSVGVLDEAPDEWTSTIGQTTTTIPWLGGFVSRMWRMGVQRRDAEVRTLWRLLRQQRRLGRGSWVRQFLAAAWRRGVQPRDPQIRQFARQLREWGLLPRLAFRPGLRPGLPSWYLRPPWWYTQPPAWYRAAPPAGLAPFFPRVFPSPPLVRPVLPAPPLPPFARATQAALGPVAQVALGPGGLLPTVAQVPGQALQTAASALTAPARFVTSLFR